MMLRLSPKNFRAASLLLVLSIVGAAVAWRGGSLWAQAGDSNDNMRQRMFDLRAGLRNADARPATAILSSTTVWGIATDFFVPADYDGDGKNDHAIWRPGAAGVAQFQILKSSDGLELDIIIGQSGDDPTVIGDYDGDGKVDAAVYRAGATAGAYSTWIYHPSGGGADVTVTCSAALDCGKNGDFPAPGDYNGDGKSDFMVQRNHGPGCATDNNQGTPAPYVPNADFLLTLNGGSTTLIPCVGHNTDVIVPGDYDGDGRTDIAVLRGVSGQIEWTARLSSTSTFFVLKVGASATDYPTQGDYDGDGRTDFAIWRPSITPGASIFLIHPSSGGPNFQVAHGQNGDYPVANWNTH